VTEHHGEFEERLPPQPASVAEARRLVRRLLERCEREDLTEPAVLLVSEIVTNALLHAGTDIELRARVDDRGVRIEVGDGSSHLPSRRSYAPTSGTGRGLLMIESMVDDWGVTRHAHGKTVWFELSSDGDERRVDDLAAPRTDGPRWRRRASDNVPVALHNMPLLLHAAWQEHAEALLREYLLASLDSEGEDPIQMHAEATDAIAVLEEYVPRADVNLSPDHLMGDATEPRVSASLIEVPVPVGSVSHFETLDRAIQAALDLSEEGLVLTPPTQPEVQAFRRWLCRQVLRQADGDTPEPWTVPRDDRLAPAEVVGWDVTTVTHAEHGIIAANQSSQIIAVSPEAARILGYDDGSELVGARIVSIVPERYRQAHVAGFTMYLLVGRRPLLDNAVVVPALRRDGTEVEVELVVRDHGIGEGRSVLLADLRETGGVDPPG
jgi:PAS domain S-box-containing protein